MKHIGESSKRTAAMKQQYGNCKGMANGGRVKAYTAGAASGEGRIQKTERYGTTTGAAAAKEMAGMERSAKRK